MPTWYSFPANMLDNVDYWIYPSGSTVWGQMPIYNSIGPGATVNSGVGLTAVGSWPTTAQGYIKASGTDFVSATAVRFYVKCLGRLWTNDIYGIYVRLFKSDGTTPLTDEMLLRGNTSHPTGWSDSTIYVNATGVNTTATKAEWDAAVYKFRLAITISMGADGGGVVLDDFKMQIDHASAATLSQNAYRFYQDQSESASTALAAQDTPLSWTPSADLNCHLRIRVQSTNAYDINNSTTDYKLQYEKNASGTWLDADNLVLSRTNSPFQGGGLGEDSSGRLGSTTSSGDIAAVSFQGDGYPLGRAGFRVWKSVGTPTGVLGCSLISHTGTYGTGTPQLVSSLTSAPTIPVANIPAAGGQWVYWDFDRSYTLANGTPYYIGASCSQAGNASNNFEVATQKSSGWAGNSLMEAYGGAFWTALPGTDDFIFEVYTCPPQAVDVYNSANLTEGANTTNRLTGGTGTFRAGKVAKTGIAHNVDLWQNDFTELLYSLTLESANVANGDTLRFRVVRDGSTASMTYAVTPTISVASGPQAYNETNRPVVITSTITTPTLQTKFKQLLLPVAVASTVTSTDTQKSPQNYNETLRSVVIASTVTKPVDKASYKETGGAAPVVYTDNFNRADGDPGSNWAVTASGFLISGNQLVRTGAGGGGGPEDYIEYVAQMPSSDHYVQARLVGGTNQYTVIHARATVSLGYARDCYMGYWHLGLNAWAIGKNVGGTFFDVGNYFEAHPGDPVTLRLEVQGSDQRLYVNGVVKAQTTDTDIISGTGVGLNAGPNFAQYEDFEAGLFGGGGGGGGLSLTLVSTITSTDAIVKHYSETGRSVVIVSTVARTDKQAHKELTRAVALVSATTTTDKQAHKELVRAVAVISTITSTDTQVSGAQNYNETGRQVVIVSTVTTTDQRPYKELALSVAAISAITTTDRQAHKELALPVAVVSTITTTDLLKRGETGRSVAIVSTVASTERSGYKQLALPVAVISTYAATDSLKRGETGRAVAIVSTVASTEILRVGETLRSVAIVSGFTVTDLQTAPGHYDETNRSVSLLVTTTLPVDQADFKDPARGVAIVSVVATPVDQADFKETGRAVAIASTVATTDVYHRYDLARPVAIVSTVTQSVDKQTHKELTRGVAVVSTVTSTDQPKGGELLRQVAVVSTVTSTDKQTHRELVLSVAVVSTITTPTDHGTFKDLVRSTVIVSTVTSFDSLAGAPIFYNETNRQINIVSTLTTTDRAFFRSSQSITVVSTVTLSALLHQTEPALVTVTSTLTTVDQAHYKQLALSVAIVSTMVFPEHLTRHENLAISVVSTVTAPSRAAYHAVLGFNAAALFAVLDASHASERLRALAIIATFRVIDYQVYSGGTVLNRADALFLGNRTVDAVYAGTTKVWP